MCFGVCITDIRDPSNDGNRTVFLLIERAFAVGLLPTIKSFADGIFVLINGQISLTKKSTASEFGNHLKVPTNKMVGSEGRCFLVWLNQSMSTPLATTSMFFTSGATVLINCLSSSLM